MLLWFFNPPSTVLLPLFLVRGYSIWIKWLVVIILQHLFTPVDWWPTPHCQCPLFFSSLFFRLMLLLCFIWCEVWWRVQNCWPGRTGHSPVEVRRLPYGGHAGHATMLPPLQLRPWIVVSSGSGPVDMDHKITMDGMWTKEWSPAGQTVWRILDYCYFFINLLLFFLLLLCYSIDCWYSRFIHLSISSYLSYLLVY